MKNISLANRSLFIAMAGLPGTGKSAIAHQLGKRLDALILNKDVIRAELFEKEAIVFSREQDDLCMKAIFVISEYILRANSKQSIIVDGRTFSKSYQIKHLLSRSEFLKVNPIIIECTCDDSIVKRRLNDSLRSGTHPAHNRTYRLYLELKDKSEPITVDRLVIDTGVESLEKSVNRSIEYLKHFLH
jgi:predicted kinase